MNFDIRPTISVSHQIITVTSSRPVSSNLWTISCKFDNLGVFNRDRPKDSDNNVIDTQLIFWKNPGYETKRVMSLIIPALYIAAVWSGKNPVESVTNFWSLDLDEHISRIEKLISFPEDVVIDNEACNYVLSTWLTYSAWSAARNSFEELKNINMDSSYTNNRVNFANRALKSLRFMDPQKTFIGAETITGYIKEIECYLPKLRRDHEFLCNNQEMIDRVKAKVVKSKDLLQISLGTTEIVTQELFLQWKDYFSLLNESITRCNEIVGNFDYTTMAQIVSRILEISPEK